MIIVAVDEIPKETNNVSLEKLSDIYSKAQQMEKICVSNNGVGLAAVQVGLPWKFFVYSDEKEKFHYMIDCEYKPKNEDKHLSVEGCLSLRKQDGSIRHFKVMRYDSIEVSGKELVVLEDKITVVDLKKIINKGLECVVFQHEIDHQNNILISDIGEEIFIDQAISTGDGLDK